MKKAFKLLLLSASLAMTSSCKKKIYTCGHSIFYQSVSVVFKGFTSADLKKVVVKTYQEGNRFDNPLSVDTFDYSYANFRGDTAYIHLMPYDENIGFYDINSGNDYSFTVLSTNDVYKITDVRGGKSYESWFQNDECSMGAGQAAINPLLLNINGNAASPFYLSANRFLVCLIH